MEPKKMSEATAEALMGEGIKLEGNALDLARVSRQLCAATAARVKAMTDDARVIALRERAEALQRELGSISCELREILSEPAAELQSAAKAMWEAIADQYGLDLEEDDFHLQCVDNDAAPSESEFLVNIHVPASPIEDLLGVSREDFKASLREALGDVFCEKGEDKHLAAGDKEA